MGNELKILKAVLMLRRLGNKYQSKEEQREEQRRWLEAGGEEYSAIFNEWIESMREDLAKSPEELEAERKAEFELFLEREAEWDYWDYKEQLRMREELDEWDDLWSDRAREVGAVLF